MGEDGGQELNIQHSLGPSTVPNQLCHRPWGQGNTEQHMAEQKTSALRAPLSQHLDVRVM